MRRRLFTVLSALSLLLFVAACAMWVRSYRWEDMYSTDDGLRWRGFVSRRGWLDYGVVQVGQRTPGSGWPWFWHATWVADSRPQRPLALRERLLGVTWNVHGGADAGVPYRIGSWGVAYRNVAGCGAVLPAVWLVRVRRRRRRAVRRLCPSCGYDLRATPKRCPECGAVPTVSS